MADVTVFSIKKSFSSTKNIEAPDYEYVVKLTKVDKKMADALAKDPLFRQEIVEEAQKEHTLFAKGIQKFLNDLEKKLIQPDIAEEVQAYAKRIPDIIAAQVESSISLAEKNIMAAWKGLAAKREEYKSYQIKQGLSVGAKIGFMAISVGLTASGGAGNIPGMVIGIVGVVKEAAELAKQVYELAIEAETVASSLSKDVDKLNKAFANSKARLVAQEMGSAVINTLFVEVMATIPGCADKLDSLKAKTSGIEVGAHDSAEKLELLLKKAEATQKAVDKIATPDKKMQGLKKDLVGLEKQVDKLLAEIPKSVARVKALEPELKSLKKQVEELQKMRPEGMAAFDVALALSGAAFAAARQDWGGVAEELGKLTTDWVIDKATSLEEAPADKPHRITYRNMWG